MNAFSLWLEKTFGANYKVSLSHIGTLIFLVITFLAGVSYETIPMAAQVIPPDWKPKIALISGICTIILWFYNGLNQKQKNVSGGDVVPDKFLAGSGRALSGEHRFAAAKRIAGTDKTIHIATH